MSIQLPLQEPIAIAASDRSAGPQLSALAVGSSGVVARVGGQRVFRRRLMEMGLIPGTAVRVVNVAPLGDPLEIEVRGCRLSIRREEAKAIALEPQRPLRIAQ